MESDQIFKQTQLQSRQMKDVLSRPKEQQEIETKNLSPQKEQHPLMANQKQEEPQKEESRYIERKVSTNY